MNWVETIFKEITLSKNCPKLIRDMNPIQEDQEIPSKVHVLKTHTYSHDDTTGHQRERETLSAVREQEWQLHHQIPASQNEKPSDSEIFKVLRKTNLTS